MNEFLITIEASMHLAGLGPTEEEAPIDDLAVVVEHNNNLMGPGISLRGLIDRAVETAKNSGESREEDQRWAQRLRAIAQHAATAAGDMDALADDSFHRNEMEPATKLKPIAVPTTVEIPAQRIADIMVSAMECNHMTRSWVAAVRLRTPTEDHVAKEFGEPNWYASPKLWAGKFLIELWEIEDESIYKGGFDPETQDHFTSAQLAKIGLQKRTIERPDLDAGIQLMASKHGHHFGNWMAENDDAITADVLLQLVVLKKVVHG